MSRIGSNLLPGHSLRGEGVAGSTWRRDASTPPSCSCGAEGQPDVSGAEAKRWHARHKDDVRARAASDGARG